ncbi:MAG: MFS transporter [Anaerolineae bacterium]|nr:MFS transporter [Anaerolineae bacterium]
MDPKDRKRRLGLIFFFVFIDLLGYSLILPLLPYYAETYNANATLVGLLGTSNALAQFFAAPIIGRLSDRYGRRPLLIFSILGTVVSFLILGLANTLGMIFISRIMDGVLGGNVSLARAYITDITDESNRAKSLGIIGAAFGLGFIFGPALGGFLSRFGFSVPAFLAAGLSLVNLVLVIIWLPESISKEEQTQRRRNPQTAFTLQLLLKEIKRPCVGQLLQITLAFSLAFTLFTSSFALFSKDQLGFTAQTTSYLLTMVGVIQVFVQGFAIGRLTSRFKERQLILFGVVILTISFIFYTFTNSFIWMIINLIPIALLAGVVNTTLPSQLSKSVIKEDVGGTLGLSAAAQTFAQIVCPIIGGLLIGNVGGWAIGLTAAALMLVAVFLIWKKLLPLPDPVDGAQPCQPILSE